MQFIQRIPRLFAGLFFAGLSILFSTGCGVTGAPISISVPVLAAEDLAGPCRFDLSMAQPDAVQKGVLVIFERGDSARLYNDAGLRQTVAALGYAVVWAHECNAKSTGDLQADAKAGPGRVLMAALDGFAQQSGHHELSTASLVLYGFSAAGVLSATLADEVPARLLGVIEYAPGSAYTDLDDVPVSSAAAGIPTLILANALDSASGTERSLSYFKRGRSLGAPWAYAVQNGTNHCCNLSTRNIILPWIGAIAQMHSGPSANESGGIDLAATGAMTHFICTPDGVEDAQKQIDCSFTSESVGTAENGHEESGWLPSQTSGAAWLSWVTSPQTN